MNKTLQTVLVFLLLPALLYAQNKRDSTSYQNALLSQNFYTDSLIQQSYNFAKGSSYYLNALMPDRVSKLSLRYSFQKGNYIPSQGATKINAGSLSTEGTAKLGTVKLFGAFTYQKTFEDSTSFAHQTRNNPTTPYYFGSPAYVHYERSVYTFKAMAGRNFFNNKLNLSFGTDYKVGNHFSTNDPRGDIGEYQFDLMAALGYRVSERIKIGLAYRNGYGQERVNIGYKNPRYYESSVYPIYYNHLINGYGEGRPVLSGKDRVYTDNQTRNGFDAYLDIKTSDAGNFYLSGSYVKEHQRYFHSTSDGFSEFSGYNLRNAKFNLLWFKKLQAGGVGTLINFFDLNGKDLNAGFNANNYIYSGNTISAKIFISRYSSKNVYNHFIQINRNLDEQIDGVKANKVQYDNLLFTAGTGIRRNMNNSDFWGVSLSAQYKMPVHDTFQVAQANEGYFTRYVIYHDYLYNTSSCIGTSLTAEYGFKVFRTMQAALKINAAYFRKLDLKPLDRTIVSSPGKDRFSSDISLNLYF